LQPGGLRYARPRGGGSARGGSRNGAMSPTVLVEREGEHLAHLVLNRPEVLNAIDNTLALELTSAADALAADAEVWAVILRGAGDHAEQPLFRPAGEVGNRQWGGPTLRGRARARTRGVHARDCLRRSARGNRRVQREAPTALYRSLSLFIIVKLRSAPCGSRLISM